MRSVSFWKAFLNIEEYRDEDGFMVYEMTDESFFEQCELYADIFLLSNYLFNGYYITHFDHLDDLPFVVRMRYLASFAAAG